MSRRRTRQRHLAAHFGTRRDRELVTFTQALDAIIASLATILAPIFDAVAAIGRAAAQSRRQDDYILTPPGNQP